MSNPEVLELELTKVIEDKLLGSEGPVFDKNGEFYMVAPEVEKAGVASGEVWKVNLETGKTDLICQPRVGEDGGIPAGCQCDLDNNIWIADMRLGILKMDSTGKYEQVFKVDSEGRALQGCNDCAFDYEGNLWVTAPAGDIAPAAYTRAWDEAFGSVYCVTKDKVLVRIDTDFRFPNGIAVQHTAEGKPSKLIVAETPTKLLWAYDILGPGKVGPRSVWGKVPGDHVDGPDGMDFDEEGNLLVANHGGGHIEVYSSKGGDPIARIKCPFKTPSNVHFKPGTSTVYITEHDFHVLWKMDWKHKGKKQYCETQ